MCADKETNPLVQEEDQKDQANNRIEKILNRIGFGVYQYLLLGVTGTGSFADGAEVTIFSLVSFMLEDEWSLSAFQLGLMGGIIFGGMSLGYIIIGIYGDEWGRLEVVKYTYAALFLLGIASALMPEFWSFIVLRGFAGVAISMSVPPYIALSVESCTTEQRGAYVMIVELMFGVGQIYIVLIAMWLAPNLESDRWRELLIAAAIPIIIGIVFSMFVVESPLFSARKQRYSVASNSLEYIAKVNKKPPLDEEEYDNVYLTFPLHVERDPTRFSFLFDKTHKLTTLLLMCLWSCVIFSYYGLFYILPRLFGTDEEDSSVLYLILIAIGAQCLITLGSTYLIDLPALGRKGALKLSFFFLVLLSAVSIPLADGFAIYVLVILINSLNNSTFCMLYTYTSEVYETELRELGFSVQNAIGRAATLFAPFVFTVLLDWTKAGPFILLLVTNGLMLVATFLLPFETCGKFLDSSWTE